MHVFEIDDVTKTVHRRTEEMDWSHLLRSKRAGRVGLVILLLNFSLFFSFISNLCFPALNDLAVPVLGISCQNHIDE